MHADAAGRTQFNGDRTWGMLRVTKAVEEDLLEIWELEGKLSGEWVKELNRCWLERKSKSGVKLYLNLKAVTFIDLSGKQLLKEMHDHGVEIKGYGCMTRAVVEEIVGSSGLDKSGKWLHVDDSEGGLH
jgi:anti-anti-sigma regulatory factor